MDRREFIASAAAVMTVAAAVRATLPERPLLTLEDYFAREPLWMPLPFKQPDPALFEMITEIERQVKRSMGITMMTGSHYQHVVYETNRVAYEDVDGQLVEAGIRAGKLVRL